MKINWWKITRFFLGILIICLLIYKIGFSALCETFKNIDIRLYFLFLLISVLTNFILGTLNISILLSKIKKINFSKLLSFYSLSWALGLFVPGKLGEFSIVYFFKKEEIEIGKGTAVAIIDKFITFVVLSIFSIIGFFIFFSFYDALKISLIIIFVIILFLILITNKKIMILVRKIIGGLSNKFSGFSRTFKHYLRHNKKILLYNFIITSVKWIITGISVFVLFRAFGETNIGIVNIILVNSIVLIAGLIPITINGLGIKQLVALFLFDKINVNPSITLSVYIVTLTTNYCLAALILLFSRMKFGTDRIIGKI